jgi:hypothetical protein
VQACRLGLVRLLSLECVLSHAAVRVEVRKEHTICRHTHKHACVLMMDVVVPLPLLPQVNKFIQKWWVRLHQAAAVLASSRQSATLQPVHSPSRTQPQVPTHHSQLGGGAGDAHMSIPPAVRHALEVLADLMINPYPDTASNKEAGRYLPVFERHISTNDLPPDVALLSLAFGCRQDVSSESTAGMSFLMHFIGSPADPRAGEAIQCISYHGHVLIRCDVNVASVIGESSCC